MVAISELLDNAIFVVVFVVTFRLIPFLSADIGD